MTEPRPAAELASGAGPGLPAAQHRDRQHGRRPTNRVSGPPHLLRVLLPARLAAVLAWEVAALAVLVGYQHRQAHFGRPVLITLGVLAALVVLSSSIRFAGLTGLERIAAGRALRRRNRRYRSVRSIDTVQRRLLTGLTLNTHIDRAGNRTGVIGAGLGWSAAIRISDSVTPDPATLIAAATRACLRRDLPLAAAQVISWNVPASWDEPGTRSASGTVSRSASGPILDTVSDPASDTGSARGAAQQRTLHQYFVAVRTAPGPSGRAILARGGGASGAQRATASAAAALAFELTRLGYRCTVLDSSELEQHVQLFSGASYSGQRSDGPDGSPTPLETKDTWAVGQLQQSCFRIGSGTSQAAALNWPVRNPLSFVVGSATVTADRRGGGRVEYLMRAGMINRQSPLTVEQASRGLDRRLVPMRCRQERGVRSTLPLALGQPDRRDAPAGTPTSRRDGDRDAGVGHEIARDGGLDRRGRAARAGQLTDAEPADSGARGPVTAGR